MGYFNVTTMKYMFYKCISLICLPDISNWKTNNVIDMTAMFQYCTKLSSLPDISKWNIKNGENMFLGCKKALLSQKS